MTEETPPAPRLEAAQNELRQAAPMLEDAQNELRQAAPRLEDVQNELRQAVQEVVTQLQRDLLEASARLQAEIRQELQYQRAGFCELIDSAQPPEVQTVRTQPRGVRRTEQEEPEDGISSSDSDESPDLFSANKANRLRSQTAAFTDESAGKSALPKDKEEDPNRCAYCGNIFMSDANFCRKCGVRRDQSSKEASSDKFGSRQACLSRLVSSKMKKKKLKNGNEAGEQVNPKGEPVNSKARGSVSGGHQNFTSVDPQGICILRKKDQTSPYPNTVVVPSAPPAAAMAPAATASASSSDTPQISATAPAASASSAGTLAALANADHRPQVDEAAGTAATSTPAPPAVAPSAVPASSSTAPIGPTATVGAPAQPGVVALPLGGAPALAQPGPDMAGGVQHHNISFPDAPFHFSPGPETGAGNEPGSTFNAEPEQQSSPCHQQHFSFSPGESGAKPCSPINQKPTRKTGEISQIVSSHIGSVVSKAKSNMSLGYRAVVERFSEHSSVSTTKSSNHRVVPTSVTDDHRSQHSWGGGAGEGFRSVETSKSKPTPAQEELGHSASKAGLDPQMRNLQAKDYFWELVTGQMSFRFVVGRLVCTGAFDYLTTFLVALNACSIGAQTDWEVRHIGEATPQTFKIIETVFCILFSSELFLRIYVDRCQFFRIVAGWRWNAFDCLVVAMQILDLVFSMWFGTEEAAGDVSKKFSFIRILRILRLVRIIRVVRILRFIRELRMMVCSIANSLRSLMWTIILIFLMIYVVSVYLTQLVSDHGRYHPGAVEENMPLQARYGSLWQSILSLFQAMTGGVDWEDLSNPLMDNISPLLGLVFTLYIAFAVLAMMNVVTAVFIESALLRAKEDKESELTFHMRNLMSKVDTDCSGMISWETFQYLMEDGKMQRNFRALELDLAEAKGLFNLLDIEGNGRISAEEFVSCCLQLRGPAKAIDVATLLYHNRRMSCRWKAHSRHVEFALDEIMEMLCASRNTRNKLGAAPSSRMSHCATGAPHLMNRDSNFQTWEELKSSTNDRLEPKDLS